MPVKEKCSQCMYMFSMLKLPRKLSSCQHSICETCIKEIIETKQDMIICGFCSAIVKKEEIRIFPLNTPLLLALSETPIIQQSAAKQDENELLGDIMLTGCQPPAETVEQQLCPTHKVVLDIICISDKQRICPHCALFGSHRQHRFKRLDDFDRELKDKKRIFQQIQADKQKFMKSDLSRIGQELRNRCETRKGQLRERIESEFKLYQEELVKKKEDIFQEIQTIFARLQIDFRGTGPMGKFEKVKEKLEKWEKACLDSLFKLQSTKRVEDRLYYYYEGPLEIVTEGYIFIEQLNKHREQTLKKINQSISEVKVVFEDSKSWFQRCAKVVRNDLTNQVDVKEGQDCLINPFLDCTKSQIVLGTSSFLQNNTSLEVDIDSIPSSSKLVLNEKELFMRTPKRRQTQVKAVRSIQKDRPRMLTQTSTAVLKKPLILTPKTPSGKRPVSQLGGFRSPGKLVKNVSGKEEEKSNIKDQSCLVEKESQLELKEPEKIYLQFSKNTLSDFFDISQCGLSSDKVVEFVHRARRTHKIRGLKICNNGLTTAGFDRLTEFLQGVSNINAANNQINQGIFEVIVKQRERLDSLRVVNLAHNPITLDKKAISRLEEVKRMGIIVTF